MTNDSDSIATLRLLAKCGSMDLSMLGPIADEVKQLRADISEAYHLRDKAEGRYCTALGTIEQLHAAVKTAQELAATRLQEVERLRAKVASLDNVIDYWKARAGGSSEPCEVRPLSEWHEDDGPAVWWKFPVEEAAWIGGPNDSDWPGYHTHWTPHPPVPLPSGINESLDRAAEAIRQGRMKIDAALSQGASRDASSEPCEHLRSEFLAQKLSAQPPFEMRKCLDCTKIFRKRLTLKSGEGQ